VVSPDVLSPAPSTSSAVKSLENTEEYPDDPEPATAGNIQMEYCSDWLYSPNIGTVIKINCKILGQYRYRLIIHNIR
jgi:hypothetical protein